MERLFSILGNDTGFEPGHEPGSGREIHQRPFPQRDCTHMSYNPSAQMNLLQSLVFTSQ